MEAKNLQESPRTRKRKQIQSRKATGLYHISKTLDVLKYDRSVARSCIFMFICSVFGRSTLTHGSASQLVNINILHFTFRDDLTVYFTDSMYIMSY